MKGAIGAISDGASGTLAEAPWRVRVESSRDIPAGRLLSLAFAQAGTRVADAVATEAFVAVSAPFFCIVFEL